MKKVLITTVPFSAVNTEPIRLLENAGIQFDINPLNRKLTEDDLVGLISNYEAIIAGTEPITKRVLDHAHRLKLICRVGVGLDNVDLLEAKKKNILVSYTPEAPAPAVAELTIAMIFSLLRSLHMSNIGMHKGEWNRFFGRRISEVVFGIIGLGRIGSRVCNLLESLGAKEIYINDIDANITAAHRWPTLDKEALLRVCDVITLHTPLTNSSYGLIAINELKLMKPNALLVNTSRGGIVNEVDLAHALKTGLISGAAIDVFETEPYRGILSECENCLLSSHMGSMSEDCRAGMEIQATVEIVRHFRGERLMQLVPESEYCLRSI